MSYIWLGWDKSYTKRSYNSYMSRCSATVETKARVHDRAHQPSRLLTAFFPDRVPDYVSGRGPDLFSSVSRHFAHPVPPRTSQNICNRIGCHLPIPFTSCGINKRDHFPMLSVGKTFAKSARDGRDGSKPNYAVHPHRLYSGMAHRTEKQARPGTRYT